MLNNIVAHLLRQSRGVGGFKLHNKHTVNFWDNWATHKWAFVKMGHHKNGPSQKWGHHKNGAITKMENHKNGPS